MELAQARTAAELAISLGAEIIGEANLLVTGLNEIHHVRPGDLCFVDHPRYYEPTLRSAASAILINKVVDCPAGKALLVLEDPFAAYNGLVRAQRPPSTWSGRVDASAILGDGVTVATGAVVGAGVRIGRDSYVGPNAVITEGVRIGKGVYIGAGAVIGEEAFYFKKTSEGYLPWRSGGTVLIEDDVFIGANCNISRGVSAPTRIGRGTKLDALVQIGHDCQIGEHCLFAAQVGVAGNTTVGDWSVLQGQAGVTQNLTLAERTTLLAQSGLMEDTDAGTTYFGSPAQESRRAFRSLFALRKLSER